MCTFVEVLLGLSYIGDSHPIVAKKLAYLVPKVAHGPLFWLHLPVSLVGYGILAAGVAVLEYAFRLHERLPLSRYIRSRFETKCILVPLAAAVGSRLSEEELGALRSNSPDLMDQVFYRYGGSEKPVIDAHLVSGALDSWRWVWTFLESAVVCVLCAAVLAVLHDWVGLWIGIHLCMAFGLLSWLAIRQASSYAIREVLSISRLGPEVKDHIRHALSFAEFHRLPRAE